MTSILFWLLERKRIYIFPKTTVFLNITIAMGNVFGLLYAFVWGGKIGAESFVNETEERQENSTCAMVVPLGMQGTLKPSVVNICFRWNDKNSSVSHQLHVGFQPKIPACKFTKCLDYITLRVWRIFPQGQSLALLMPRSHYNATTKTRHYTTFVFYTRPNNATRTPWQFVI